MASIEMKTMEVYQDNEAEEDDLENIENIKKIQDAFNCFDRSKSGRISIRVSNLFRNTLSFIYCQNFCQAQGRSLKV